MSEHLVELKITPDSKTNAPRKWFASDTLDIVVWLTPDEKFKGFQLTLEEPNSKQIVTYTIGGKVRHNSLGEDTTDELSNRAAAVGEESPCDCKKLAAVFLKQAQEIETTVQQWIFKILDSKH